MEIQAIKLNLMMWVGSLQDPEVLKELLRFRRQKESNGHTNPFLKRLTHEELIARALESEKAIAEGDVIDIDDLALEYGINIK